MAVNHIGEVVELHRQRVPRFMIDDGRRNRRPPIRLRGMARMGIGQIFLGAAPFLLANVAVLVLIRLFPQLVLWIPQALYGI